jgi:hypothetical protein
MIWNRDYYDAVRAKTTELPFNEWMMQHIEPHLLINTEYTIYIDAGIFLYIINKLRCFGNLGKCQLFS